ncbi:MAG: trigger factor [Clostridia bacterium]|nr:trigger factor [Clostridia bacterium]
MGIKIEKTDKKNELKLEFNVEAEKFEEAIKKVYARNSKYFNIPGFRKGKAPMNIVEKYYGAQVFYEDAFNELAEEEFGKALQENEISMIGKPNVDISQIEKGKELIFTITIETKPEVEVKNYKGIEIKKIEYNVEEKDIEHELGHMAEKNSKEITIEEGGVEKNDIATIDFEGFLNGEAFDGGKGENYDLTIGSNTFIPGFEDQIIGMKNNEEKDVIVTFPEEYASKDLAGKEATFKVKVNSIRRKELPVIDDEFAKDTSEFDTLKELKDSIKEKLQEENEHKAKHETEEAVIKAIKDSVTIDIPKAMIETEIDNIKRDIETRLSYQGLKFEQYLKMINKTEEEFRAEYQGQAEDAVKTRLVMEAIVRQEKIEADDESLKEKVKELAAIYGKDEEEIMNNEEFKKYIKNSIKFEKAIDFVVENAKIK